MIKQILEIGRVVATAGALDALRQSSQSPSEFLNRHLSGDWGDLDEEDRQTNNDAVEHGYRVLSAYKLNSGTRLWVITEADRSSTCLLLPEEY